MSDEPSKRKQRAKERKKQKPVKQAGNAELPSNDPSALPELSDDELKEIEGGAERSFDAGRLFDAGR